MFLSLGPPFQETSDTNYPGRCGAPGLPLVHPMTRNHTRAWKALSKSSIEMHIADLEDERYHPLYDGVDAARSHTMRMDDDLFCGADTMPADHEDVEAAMAYVAENGVYPGDDWKGTE